MNALRYGHQASALSKLFAKRNLVVISISKDLTVLGVVTSKAGRYEIVPEWAYEIWCNIRTSENYLIKRLARISVQEPALIAAAMTCYALGGVDALTAFVINVVPEATPIALP